MGAEESPTLEYTNVESIPGKVNKARQAFLDNKTRDVEFRLVQLRKLYWA